MVAYLRNIRQQESEAIEFISSVILGKIVENLKLTPKGAPGLCSGKLDSVPDAGAIDRAGRRRSSRAAMYLERSMDGGEGSVQIRVVLLRE